MAGVVDIAAIDDALIVLGAASIVVPLAQRFGVNTVIAFLGAGFVLGPHGLGALVGHVPFIQWVTITDRERVSAFAEFGVVFLLFVIGLELSLARLKTMRRLVFGLGLAQVALSIVALGAIGSLFLDIRTAYVIAAALALSSTAIVIDVLAARNRVGSSTGRASFAVLIFQDLAVIPVLFVVDALGGEGGGSLLQGLAYAFLQAVVTIAVIVAAGHFLLRPFFRLVASQAKSELFMAATLFVAIGTGVAAATAGLSMALGAFIAGLLLAETEYRRAIETTIEPFKALLLGVFFFAVGMSIEPAILIAHPFVILAIVAAVLLVKGVVIFGLGKLFHLPTRVALEAAFLLAPAGEFAFVVVANASATAVIGVEQATIVTAATAISMALIPSLGTIGRRLGQRLETPVTPDPDSAAAPPEDHEQRAIIIGYGRVGRLVGDMLTRHKIAYLAVDADARSVAHWRRQGAPVYWGDAANATFLAHCGLAEATALVVTIDQAHVIEAVVRNARTIRPDLPIVARARDAEHARALYAAGVTDAVPETIEASLQLSEAALAGLGVATGPVIASIHERREEFRRELQGAAGRPTRALQAKRRKLL